MSISGIFRKSFLFGLQKERGKTEKRCRGSFSTLLWKANPCSYLQHVYERSCSFCYNVLNFYFYIFENLIDIIILLDILLSLIGALSKYFFLPCFKSLRFLFLAFSIIATTFYYIFCNNNFTFSKCCFENINIYINTSVSSLCLANVFIFDQKETISVSSTPSGSITSYHLVIFYFIGAILSSIFYKKDILILQLLPFLIYTFLCFSANSLHKSKNCDLKCCPNNEFLSTELIKITGDINSAEILMSCYFALNKLKIKRSECFKFYHLILLSGDVSLNPGPSQYPPYNDDKFEPFHKRGLHFLHLNVNSLLSKIDELRDVVGHIKPSILGITESKIDSFASDQEVNISGYSILRSDRNRYGGGVACYVRADLCFNRRNVFSNSIENVFFDLLIPKLKPLSIGIFYRPPHVNTFLETFANELKLIDLKETEVYFLGDFNINLLVNDKFVLKENQSLDFRNLNCPLMSKYKELCQTFSLKEVIQEPTRIRSTTSSLLDHILTNAGWKISQKGVIDVGHSDHQLIYCTRKILRTKANMHNQIRVRSLRKYTPELLIKKLKKINFPKYNIFSNVNIAYLDLVEKILSVVDKIAPFKDLRIKNNTQDWFDDEVAKAIKLREKRRKQFESTKLLKTYIKKLNIMQLN